MEKPVSEEQGVDLGRRRISVAAAMALLGGAAVTLTACGGGASPTRPTAPPAAPPPPTPVASPAAQGCPAASLCGQVSVDPQHAAVISNAQLEAGGALEIDITGTQGHSHVVSLTAEEVVAIRRGQRVEKVSSLSLNHGHTVTFN